MVFSRNAFVYLVGRGTSVLAQVVLAACCARFLPISDVAAFAVGTVFAMLSGTLGNPNIRRMVMDNQVTRDLSSLKAATAVMNLLILIGSASLARLMFDRDTAMAAFAIGLWRLSDNYGEIGIGLRLFQGRQDVAGLGLVIRSIVGSGPTILLFIAGHFEAALLAGAATRFICCLLETESATGGQWSVAGIKGASKLVVQANGYASAAIACMAFDVVPTVLLSKFAASEYQLALLAPLGRIRLGLVTFGTLALDSIYPRFLQNRTERTQLRALLRQFLGQILAVAGLLTVILTAGGARLIFGPLLQDAWREVLAACLAAIALIVASAASSLLTSLGRLRFQSWVFAAATVIMSVATFTTNSSITGFYLTQTAIMLIAAGSFYAYIRALL